MCSKLYLEIRDFINLIILYFLQYYNRTLHNHLQYNTYNLTFTYIHILLIFTTNRMIHNVEGSETQKTFVMYTSTERYGITNIDINMCILH